MGWAVTKIRAVFLALLVLASGPATAAPKLRAIGVENQYADVIAAVGGPMISVGAIETDPNTDPHSFEASPSVARRFAAASLIVENGLGYDSWAGRVIAATPRPGRVVIDVQHLLGLPNSTPNPHLWYAPRTMPAVARAVAAALARLDPADATLFRARAARFDASLTSWRQAIAAFRAKYSGTPVAVTEPVGNALLQAMGANIRTPFALQAAIMNGTDPAPQDVALEQTLLRRHEVKLLVYNRQVTDPLTDSLLALARRSGVPVVGVYETMPAPGYDYAGWMLAETKAITRAVADGRSTETLLPAAQ